jgi:hypothetical protein
VITGPVDAAGVAWCLARPVCAAVVTEPAVEAFAAALVRLRENAVLRVALATSAQAVSVAFSPATLRLQLLGALEAACT